MEILCSYRIALSKQFYASSPFATSIRNPTKFALNSYTSTTLSALCNYTFNIHQERYNLGRRMTQPKKHSYSDKTHIYDTYRRSFGSWPKIRPLRIRAVTMDVTGTLVSFRGSLSQHYVKSAEKCGVILPKNKINFDHAFKVAYKEISQSYPCFGYNTMTGKEWWRYCVIRSFQIAGANMTEVQEDRVFQRIYSVFGSQAAYERFDDALPFLRWANRNSIACGLLSNADERYGDSILPMLGLTHDEIQFHCFSKYYGCEKPDPRFFTSAIQRAEDALKEMETEWSATTASSPGNSNHISSSPSIDPLLPSQVLHVGNDYTKDFEGARRAGMHAVLLDRYDEPELAAEWRRRGAIVLKDLMDIVEFLGRSNCQLGNDFNTYHSPSKDST